MLLNTYTGIPKFVTMCQDPEVNMNILALKDGVILM